MKKDVSIYDALKRLSNPKKEIWFKYIFPDLSYGGSYTDFENVKKQTNIKSDYPIRRWKKSEEFKHLVALYLSSKSADDLIQMYDKVRERAINEADDKSVKLMLELQKQIEIHKKQAINFYSQIEEDEKEEDDGLEL